MKKFSIISVLMMVLMAGSVLAVANIDYHYNQPVVEVQGYDCTDSGCNGVTGFSGTFPTGSTTVSGQVRVRYPTVISSPNGYAVYHFSHGFIPVEKHATWAGTGQANVNINFEKVPVCSSVIDTFTVTNDAHANVPLVVRMSASLDAITRSAFALTDNGVGYVPTGYRQEFYSADTRITLTIRDGAGTIVNQQVQELTASNGNALFAGENRQFEFSWTPSTDGVYTATVTTDVIDDQCASAVPQSSSSQFSVLPALPQNECYTILNGLAANPFVGVVGQAVLLDFNKISNHANNFAFNGDPNYLLSPVPTDITYTVTGPAGVVTQQTFTIGANVDNTNPSNHGASFVSTQTGMHTVSLTGLANSPLCAGLINTPNTVTLNVNIIAPPTHKIIFQLVDATNGAPLQGASVQVAGQTFTTDATGTTMTGQLSPADYAYLVSLSGYVPLSGVVHLVDTDITVTLAIQREPVTQNSRVRFEVRNGLTQGPIPGAFINLNGDVGTADANGVRVVGPVAAGTYTWSVNAAGFNGAVGTVTTNGNTDETVIVSLIPINDGGPRTLTFHVFDAATNANLAGAQVTVTGSTLAPNGVTGVSDAAGNVVFQNMPQGAYSWFVTLAGYNGAQGGVDVAAQDVTVQVPLTQMTQPPATHTVTYHVVDAQTGADLAGASVTFNGIAGTTSATGLVTYSNVADGTYNFGVTLAGYNPAAGTTQVTGADVVVLVPLTRVNTVADIKFHVFDGSTNAPLAGAAVQFDGRAGTTDNAGNVVFTNMPSGTFNWAVSLAGYNPANGQSTVAGQPFTVNVPLTAGGGVCTVGHSVTFTVIAATNAQPIGGATVTLGSLVGTTNAQGIVTFNNVCDGTYTYTVSASGFNTLTGTLTVAGSDVSVRVELGSAGGTVPPAEAPALGIFIGSIRIPEITQEEGEVPILITFKNDGDAKLESIRVTAISTELGLRASVGHFDLSRNAELTRRVILHTEGATLEPGLYPIRLTVSNDDVTRVVYRDLEVLP